MGGASAAGGAPPQLPACAGLTAAACAWPATDTPTPPWRQVRADIVRSLQMRAPATFEVSFYRANLEFSVVQARAGLQPGGRGGAGAQGCPRLVCASAPPNTCRARVARRSAGRPV